MTGWENNARREEHRALTRVIRFNIARTWDSLSAWQQIAVAGVLWTGFWAAVLIAAQPYLMDAVS